MAHPKQITTEKTCTSCGETKPTLSFYVHRNTKDGRHTSCKECHKARTRAWNAANRDVIKARNAARDADPAARAKKYRDMRRWWMKLYGMTPEQYEQLLQTQGGVCAICSEPESYVDARTGHPRRLAVDHCHETGVVRGLLCGRCNRSIGQFAHDHARLERAAEYLRRARDK